MQADNFQAVWHYILMPGHWVQAIHSYHWLMSRPTTSHKALVPMRAPYRTRLLKCPPVVGPGFEPRSSDRELDPANH